MKKDMKWALVTGFDTRGSSSGHYEKIVSGLSFFTHMLLASTGKFYFYLSTPLSCQYVRLLALDSEGRDCEGEVSLV
jgi:hypothetical protein